MKPIIDIEIDASDLIKLADAMPAVAKDTEDLMVDGMNESGMLLDTLVAGWTPVNLGLLRGSIQWPRGFELQGKGLDEMRGIVGASDVMSASGVSTSDYVHYVEENTRPHWAPIQPLKLWAIRVLGDERAAYAVQRKIALMGTRGAHMFRRAWEAGGRDGVKRIFEAIPAKIVERLRARAGGGR
jgi:hypothetical protein